MEVLGILGSPRRGGNSEILLDQALAAAGSGGAQVQKLVLNELKFLPCQECAGCDQSGICVVNDAMQVLYQAIDAAGAVILASPIFFGSLSAQTKAMIDRYQCRWMAKEALGRRDTREPKPGILILVSGSSHEKFFKNAESIIKNFFAVANIEFKNHLYCPGIDQKAKIRQNPDFLAQAAQLGKDLAEREDNG